MLCGRKLSLTARIAALATQLGKVSFAPVAKQVGGAGWASARSFSCSVKPRLESLSGDLLA
ncbi:MAG: hypothetical protein EAZ36_04795 [Verrucomicrobia bacterium]|nr:MAG: hypothetical protein EAZ36_04795 [Verrucomicrobiota bacterium]